MGNPSLGTIAIYILTKSAYIKTSELTTENTIIEKAKEVQDRFYPLMLLFSKVHALISHSDSIPEAKLPLIQERIDEYMT